MSDHENEEWYLREYDPKPKPTLAAAAQEIADKLTDAGIAQDDADEWVREVFSAAVAEERVEIRRSLMKLVRSWECEGLDLTQPSVHLHIEACPGCSRAKQVLDVIGR